MSGGAFAVESFQDQERTRVEAGRCLASATRWTSASSSALSRTERCLAAEQIAELVAIEKKSKALTKELEEMVIASGTTLMELPGVGPVVAARTLADVRDIARFTDRNRFASWTGPAPPPSKPPAARSSGTGSPAPGTGG